MPGDLGDCGRDDDFAAFGVIFNGSWPGTGVALELWRERGLSWRGSADDDGDIFVFWLILLVD